MMYSFDIFDTLLTRSVATPSGIFLIMQEYLLTDDEKFYSAYLKKNFADLRVKAEKNARKLNTYDEISLYDIYEALRGMTDISVKNAEELMDLEVETEIKCALGISDNILKVNRLLQQTEKVVLISDMYLSEKDIRKILKRVSPIFSDIPIYISSEYRCTKRDGMLYLKVKEIENIQYNEWHHFGDNYLSDVCIPSALGIKVNYIEAKKRSPWEMAMCNYFGLELSCSLQVILGVVHKGNQSLCMNNREKMGMSLGGVILFPYVEWIIKQCLQQGISRLYFIARDGYILQQMADIYIRENQLKIHTKYIYGSRQAWRTEEGEEKEKVLRYLLQEIDLSDNKFALVDLNGTGYSVECISRLLNENQNIYISVFYYAMTKRVIKAKCNFMIYSTGEYGSLLEALCRAPHGATLGYKNLEGRYVPCLAETDENKWINCGLEDFFRGVLFFTQEFLKIRNCLNIDIEINRQGDFLLKYCNDTPDQDLVEFIGDIWHDDNNIDDRRYAPKLSKKQLFDIYMWRTTEEYQDFYTGVNYDVSLMRLNEKEQKLIRFYEKNYIRILGRIIHFYKKITSKEKNRRYTTKKKVIIYAAGKEGRNTYKQLYNMPGVKIVGWTDINYEKYIQLGYPVEPLDKLINQKYDVFLIAIKNEKAVQKARLLLLEIGVNSKYIMEKNEFYRNIGLSKKDNF